MRVSAYKAGRPLHGRCRSAFVYKWPIKVLSVALVQVFSIIVQKRVVESTHKQHRRACCMHACMWVRFNCT